LSKVTRKRVTLDDGGKRKKSKVKQKKGGQFANSFLAIQYWGTGGKKGTAEGRATAMKKNYSTLADLCRTGKTQPIRGTGQKESQGSRQHIRGKGKKKKEEDCKGREAKKEVAKHNSHKKEVL